MTAQESNEASVSGVTGSGLRKRFIHMECSHNYQFSEAADSAAVYEKWCGNPFTGKEGWEISYRGGMHGKFFQRDGYVEGDNVWRVWHNGGPTDGIGCAAEGKSEFGLSGRLRRAWVDRCVWWGPTKDGGGSSQGWGKHITPVAALVGEERSTCGDDCGGTPNPWNQFKFLPMSFYLWASGHFKFHQTSCIDCY
jgi:hypothetical protein